MYRMFYGIPRMQFQLGTKAMHGVNIDLLRASVRHHPDGRPKDPHAHHRAEHLAEQRAMRRNRWLAALASLTTPLRRTRTKAKEVPLDRQPCCP
jgi:hypothetical protein